MADRTLNVLIAEDDNATANLYAAYARARGFRVVVARDGIEALHVAETELPDAIMLDVSMPKVDGRDVCKKLKTNPRTQGIPILVVSASGGDQYLRDELVDLGVDDVVEKPIDLVIAFRKLEHMVRRTVPPTVP
jgi:DNA-binding response OmpR family regulator